MAGNSILEDINDYNKVAELFENVMKPDQERENDDVEGFGYHHRGHNLPFYLFLYSKKAN